MLHQILCALYGKPGSIIKKYPKQLAVDSSINYLLKPQIQLINQICKCGNYFFQINQLILKEFSLEENNKDILLKIAQNISQMKAINSQPSIYRKAMYQGLKLAMKQYTNLILNIEQDFLRNRHFTLANLRAQLQPFQLIMKQITQIIYHIYQKNLKGGSVMNYLYSKYQNSNILIQNWLKQMITKPITVFMNQVNMWILYGQIQDPYDQFFIHKVFIQSSQKYKFKSKMGKNIEITDWDMFTLKEDMIPSCLIQIQTAGKILLIGKIIKILRSANKISSIPDSKIMSIINQATKEYMQKDYSQVIYQGMIQEIRQIVACQIISFIMKEQNLIKELEKLNSYYLMFKGDFYHHFFEESKKIESIAQRQKAQKKINQVYLHNTFIRLGESQDIKRLSFQIKTLGFSYTNFRNFMNLCPVGSIDVVQGKSIRFKKTGTALWNRSKQIIDNNFTMVYSFSFKSIKQLIYNQNQQSKIQINQSQQPTYISLILQNSKQISGSTHQNPSYLNRIPQYIAVKVGFKYSQEQKNYISSMIIVYKDIRRNQKQIQIGKCTPKGLNFLNGKTFTVKVHYSNQTFKAEIGGQNKDKAGEIKENLKIGNYLDLQLGRAYLGFISNINNPEFSIDIEQWQMICKPSSFYNSHWSDLYLNFKVQWPINLIITPDLLQAYNRIHKFLFPIRQIQIQLESIWFSIPKLIKAQLRSTKQQMRQVKIFQRQLSGLRSEISLVINNFWSYFHSDIAGVLWNKLEKTLQVQIDFEDVIRSIKKYTQSIQIMYFFNAPKIQKKISQIIQKSRSFIIFFKNLQHQSHIDQSSYTNLAQIDENFHKELGQFYKLLKDLSKVNTSQYLYHITTRVQCCLNRWKMADKNI